MCILKNKPKRQKETPAKNTAIENTICTCAIILEATRITILSFTKRERNKKKNFN